MSFLRRLLGQAEPPDVQDPAAAPGGEGESGAPGSASADDPSERAYELELAREEQERTDELMRRQQRYADYAWTPPPQGGDRRADDEDAGRG